MRRCLGLWSLIFCWNALAQAREIPAQEVTKVSHAEGFTVETTHYRAGEAVVWHKGASQQEFLLILQPKDKPERYFTVEHRASLLVSQGKGIQIEIDQKKKLLTVTEGRIRRVEKFTREIDS